MLPAKRSGTVYSRCSAARNTRSPPMRNRGMALKPHAAAGLAVTHLNGSVAVGVALHLELETEVQQRGRLHDEASGANAVLRKRRRRG